MDLICGWITLPLQAWHPKSESISSEFSNPFWLSQPGGLGCLFSASCREAICPAEWNPADCWLLRGFAKPGVAHTLPSYLRRCPCRRRTLSPWRCRSPLLASPAGRRSASRSCPECTCRCRCTSQGIPLQGKQPHDQTHWKKQSHRALGKKKKKSYLKAAVSLCFQLIYPLALGIFTHGANCPGLVSGWWRAAAVTPTLLSESLKAFFLLVEPRFEVIWLTREVNVPNTQQHNAAFSSTEISTWKLAGKGRHFLCQKMFGEHSFSSIVILGGIHLIWLQRT